MIGSEAVRFLCRHSAADLILLMHRNRARPCGLPGSARVTCINGDVTLPGLRLSPADRQLVSTSTTHILHAAACTRFDQELDDARRINVDGTLRTAQLASECMRLQRFGYVSTAYVCGRRTGTIREDELRHTDGFVNTYEQSKYEAEQMLTEDFGGMPWSVYRLSTILGDSRTGAVHSMTAPHQAMKIMYHGLAPMMPGLADYVVDLIPGDFAGDVLARLLLNREGTGLTFHVTSRREKSLTLSDLIDRTFEAFGRIEPEWTRRRYPRPSLASIETFDAFVQTVNESGDRFLAAVLNAVQHFARQLTYPKAFDRTNVRALIPSYDDELPDIRDYYDKVVQTCLSTKWGRHAA